MDRSPRVLLDLGCLNECISNGSWHLQHFEDVRCSDYDQGTCPPELSEEWFFSLSWPDIQRKCGARANSGPPIFPDAFRTLMESKKFTKGKTDLDVVVQNYARNFN